jgi:hypothetical protein
MSIVEQFPSDGVFCVFVFFQWFCWRMGHLNAQIHKCTNSCSRLIKSSASLIEITHLCDGRRTIIWGYCVRRWQRVELEEGVEALKEVSSPQETIETICRNVTQCPTGLKWRSCPQAVKSSHDNKLRPLSELRSSHQWPCRFKVQMDDEIIREFFYLR